MNYYNENTEKFFTINGQKFKSRYVSRIQYLGSSDYGYANVVLQSGSSIHLPNEESFINFLFDQDWLLPVSVL